MTPDELLDAHTRRMRTDPGYAAIWRKASEHPVIQERQLVTMLAWAEQADGLRAMARFATGGLFAIECPSCKARIGLMVPEVGS